MNVDIIETTNTGPRPENQDAVGHKFFETALFACIADGVGGERCGALAAKICVQSLMEADETLLRSNLVNLANDLHEKILSKSNADKNCQGMATTLSCCFLDSYLLRGVHAGDSRIYVLRGNGIKQITVDQTEVARFVRNGKMSPKEALVYPRRNILDSALGHEKNLEIQGLHFTLEPGDRIILSTDGIHENIMKKDLRDLSLRSSSVNELSEKIISHVEDKGPKDNYTLSIIFVE